MTTAVSQGPTPENVRLIYEQLFNFADDETLKKYIAEDYTYRNPFKDTVGRQPIQYLVKAQLESFKDYHLELDRIIVDKDNQSVAILWTITGIFEKAFFGYLATGKAVEFKGITMQKWKNGQAVEGWGYSNMHEKLSATA